MTRRALFLTLAGAVARPAPTLEDQALYRKKGLVVHSPRPLDLETPPELLDSWITPHKRFFVRSHFYIPAVEPGRWSLEVGGLVEKPLKLPLVQLARMPQLERVVTMECAGNGRSFFEPRVAGIQWRKGAVGTARWRGVSLAGVLRQAGLRPEARHLIFDGADTATATAPDFIRSIPVEKALHPDTLIATHMNGVPLPMEHGFPARVITPGWEGAASIKWLTKITAAPEEADGFFMKTAYRYPTRPLKPGEAVDAKDLLPLTSLTVKSLITRSSGPVEGAAWAGEADITGVEVSTDGGRSWNQAQLGPDKAPFAWRRFRYGWKQGAGEPPIVMARATDSQGRTQPDTPAWNPSGYLHNIPDRLPAGRSYRPPQLAEALPEGEARQLAAEKCLACHDHALIVGQRMDPVRWTREVEKMMRWGTPLNEAEKQRVVRYLAESFR